MINNFFPLRARFFFLFILLLVFPAVFSHSQEPHWSDGFFIEGSAVYYFTPDLLSELIEPKIGFRGALGYEFYNFRFALESGFSRVTGTNPLVKEISFLPLLFKFGYFFPIYSILGLQADMVIGFALSKTLRYETVVDMVMNNLREDDERSFFAGIKLYAAISPLKYLKIYIGGGVDVIFETDGPIPLPAVEAGISLKPFLMGRSIANLRGASKTEINGIYFRANSAAINEETLSVLDEAGQRLKENPSLRVTLRAYHAPSGTEMQVHHSAGSPALSHARLNWCIEYLAQNYGIEAPRIKKENRSAGNNSALYRCVEIIVR